MVTTQMPHLWNTAANYDVPRSQLLEVKSKPPPRDRTGAVCAVPANADTSASMDSVPFTNCFPHRHYLQRRQCEIAMLFKRYSNTAK